MNYIGQIDDIRGHGEECEAPHCMNEAAFRIHVEKKWGEHPMYDQRYVCQEHADQDWGITKEDINDNNTRINHPIQHEPERILEESS